MQEIHYNAGRDSVIENKLRFPWVAYWNNLQVICNIS